MNRGGHLGWHILSDLFIYLIVNKIRTNQGFIYMKNIKNFFYRMGLCIAFFVLIPIVITLVAQGNGRDQIGKLSENKTKQEESELDEDMLTGIVANEISVTSEPEAMKAQAVIARTNCFRAIKRGENLPEGLTKNEMMRLWGSENFTEYYSQLENCIEATKGVVMTYNGEYIQADFHAASAGYTRNAGEVYQNEDFPYLKSVESRRDIPSSDFFKVMFYSVEEFLKNGQTFFGDNMQEKTAAEVLSAFVITKRDAADYVLEVAIGDNTYSGEEIRLAFDWNSSCFYLREVDGAIRVVTKGCGHGLGLSLYGAEQLAKSGYSYKDILKYYYADVEFVTTVSSNMKKE